MKKSIYLKSLRLRRKLKFIWLCWFNPEKFEFENEKKLLNFELRRHWPGRRINAYELIHEQWEEGEKSDVAETSRKFIVFIDYELAIDWIAEHDLSKESSKHVSTAESIGARRCKHLPKQQVLEFKRIVGQSVVCAMLGNTKESNFLSRQASDFLQNRTTERSRYWSLLSAHAIFLIAFLASIGNLSQIINALQVNGGIGFGLLGGFAGAYVSILLNTSKGNWDSAAGFWIHFLETFSKMLLGLLLGTVAVTLSLSVHCPPSLTAMVSDKYSIFILGLIAGFSERLIPKIISQYSNKITKSDNDTDSNNH